ncbi:hypothetical protein [Halorarum salinum]|uniref:HK97 gp10 family phage protein n=1 Tax=Halorarum salinum TaxID=2743089 RepID=A0A7D5LCM6_9EURY|nr:hypothetical protein [Halobaculum salinum]QLG62829.1 hypothetical protein HUG12_14270 [Halobaculum salinum]
MLSTSIRTRRTSNLGQKVSRGVRRGMREAADVGYAVSQDEAPKDRGAGGGLMGSGVEPTWVGDTLVWGYTAEHARPVEDGTAPHYPPIEPLKGWARRVLGDEGAAYAVQETIAQEGTEAQPYVEPGFEANAAELRQRGLTEHIDGEL